MCFIMKKRDRRRGIFRSESVFGVQKQEAKVNLMIMEFNHKFGFDDEY